MRLTMILLAAAILLAGCGMNFGKGTLVLNTNGSAVTATDSASQSDVTSSDGGTDVFGGEADVDASPLSSPSESASESGN